MGDDIVERLRNSYMGHDDTTWELREEAADEIERLNGMLVDRGQEVYELRARLRPRGIGEPG